MTQAQATGIKEALSTHQTTRVATWTTTLTNMVHTLQRNTATPNQIRDLELMGSQITTLFTDYLHLAEAAVGHPGTANPRHRLRRTAGRKIRQLYTNLGRHQQALTALKRTALATTPHTHTTQDPHTSTTTLTHPTPPHPRHDHMPPQPTSPGPPTL